MKIFKSRAFKFIFAIIFACMLIPIHITKAEPEPEPDPRPERTPEEYERELEALYAEQEFLNNIMGYLVNEIDTLQDKLESIPDPTPPPRPPIVAPRVKLISPITIRLSPGESFEAAITLRNIGTSSANSVLTQATPGGGSITLEFVNETNIVSRIGENTSREMRLNITVDAQADAGIYPIDLTHMYKDINGDNLTETDRIFVLVSGTGDAQDKLPPIIMMSNFRASKAQILPGDTFNIAAIIENLGGNPARAVSISVVSTDGVFLVNDLNTSFFSIIEGGEAEEVNYSFMVSNDARGTYPLIFRINYADSNGVPIEGSFTYHVNVLPPATSILNRAILSASNISSPQGVLNVGQGGEISFSLTNNGNLPAANIKVTAENFDDNIIAPAAATATTQLLGSLAIGASHDFTFTFAPTDLSRTRSYTIGFIIEYETGVTLDDGKPEIFTFPQYAAISVYNPPTPEPTPTPIPTPDTGGISIPRIIVSEYEVDPVIALAGQEFDLHMTFQNSNMERSVNNIKVTLNPMLTTDGQSAFTPVNGSNTYYFDEIGPKGETHWSLRMFTIPSATPRTYNLEVRFEYQDEDNNEFTQTEQIGINVRQFARIELTEPSITDSSPTYQPIYLWFSIINSGRVPLSNMRIRVESDLMIDSSQADIYHGRLNAERTLSYDGMFIPMEEGLHNCAIVITAEDETGAPIEYRHEFIVNVYEMFYDDMGGGDWFMGEDEFMRPGMGFDEWGDEDGGSLLNRLVGHAKRPYVWGPAAGLVVGAIVLIVALKKRKSKGLDFDE